MEVLLDSGATGLVISSEFAKKQGFKKVGQVHKCKKCGWFF